MVHNARGNFSFLGAAGRPFSGGVAADDGFDIAHVLLEPPAPLARGFGIVRDYLEREGRPVQALCGMELRIPAQLSSAGFDEFNRGYVDALDAFGLRVEGMLPPARTNVAPVDGSVTEPSLFAFSFTVREPALPGAYLMSGAPEAEGRESAPEALRSIVAALTDRMNELGVRWDHATAANFYAPSSAAEAVADVLLPTFGGGSATVQLTWVAAHPPVTPYRFEVDVRRCGRELTVAGDR